MSPLTQLTAKQIDDFTHDNPNFAEGFEFATNAMIVRGGAKTTASTAKNAPKYSQKIKDFAQSEKGTLPVSKATRSNKKSDKEIIKGTVSISKSKYPETASHIEDVINQGKPTILTIDRKGASQRRKEALNNIKLKVGYDRDEYPPAMFKEGGKNASVRHISPRDNRGAGSCIGHQCKQYSDGDKVKIEIKE